ncbi:casein kinase substrate phosphoprotein PP28-domain-containing protein [Immersiella caudata]|uniref:Casein kinase substrate phosphoprotein PP28-domain-containing protein n=1 Tax=Immersiella caudata TaxID=314043 RepID=A0AA39THN2_9PEZI|nr:casein kinase substrate phosphoprotein PP28-domain-containing protein [Immersiella caudata]
MAPGGPGANSRGRGGKFKKYTRGGGKHFSRDLRPLDADGNEISMWSADARKKKDDSDEDSEDDSSEEEEEEDSDEDAGPSAAAAELSREDRKKEKKARKEAALARARAQAVQVGDLPPSDSEEESDDGMPANPNHSKAARNQTKVAPPTKEVDEAAEGVKAMKVSGTPNRRERESMEAAAAKERYLKMHEAGKTDEAKADLARLKLIREKREAEAARKQVGLTDSRH